jgi:hypothetical protein
MVGHTAHRILALLWSAPAHFDLECAPEAAEIGRGLSLSEVPKTVVGDPLQAQEAVGSEGASEGLKQVDFRVTIQW